MTIGTSSSVSVEGYGAARLVHPTPDPCKQRGVASIALALMLLIMVSVAAITLSRMAGSSLSESIDASMSVAALAAADSAIERAAYRLGATTCTGLIPDGVQTVGPAGSTQANYQIVNSAGINGGCQITVLSYVGNAGNPRVLRQTQGDIAGGVVLPQHFPNPPGGSWALSLPGCLSCTFSTAFNLLYGNAPNSSDNALLAQTSAAVAAQTMSPTADYQLTSTFTGSAAPLPMSLYWRKRTSVRDPATIQTIAITLVDTLNIEHPIPVWSEATVVPSVGDSGWVYFSGNGTVPPSAYTRTIEKIRIRFSLVEGLTGSQVGAALDRVQIGGLVAWRELPN